MSRLWFCTAVLLLAAAAAPVVARADGLLYQLPEDKKFVKYDLELDVDGQGKGYAGTLYIRSTGQAFENGEKCRWIEVEMKLNQPDGEHHTIFKVLLPEKNLKAGMNPLEKIVKGWFKQNAGAIETFSDPNSVQGAPLAAFLAGPLEGVKKLDKQFEDGKLGNLECEVIKGTRELPLLEKNKIKLTYDTRRHEKAPFGVVRSELLFELIVDNSAQIKGTLRMKLAEVGADAVSALPDAQ